MKAGVYLHIPFCRSRCSYCDFATDVYRNQESVSRYVDALVKEIEVFDPEQSKIQNPKSKIPIDSVYFGGGTPSLLSTEQLGKIFAVVGERFSVENSSEITLEMNPGTVTLEKLNGFRSLGVNRASFGVQTFDDRALKLLARGHNAADARMTFELLRQAGFENVSFDLIAGLPHQTLADWEQNLDEALKLGPEHLSLYLLEIHEATPLAQQIHAGRQPHPDDDLAGKMYELMLERVAAEGYRQYEISNFSRPGFESRHNSKYWLCEPVFAFGVSAHSFDGQSTRWSNVRDTNAYVSMIEQGKSAVAETEKLSHRQLSGEFAFLGMRLSNGLKLSEFKLKFGFDLREEYAEDLARVLNLGLIAFGDDELRLTRKGMIYSNEVFSLFV